MSNKILAVLFVSIIALTGCTEPLNATSSYDTEAHNRGDETGYVKELSNGTFIVGEDIEAGLYNVSNIGWADLITMSNPLDMVSSNEDGTITNLELVDGQEVEILDQSNDDLGITNNTVDSDGGIIFTQVYAETIEAKTVTEKVTNDGTTETCYIDSQESDCSELKNYEQLEQEIISQQS